MKSIDVTRDIMDAMFVSSDPDEAAKILEEKYSSVHYSVQFEQINHAGHFVISVQDIDNPDIKVQVACDYDCNEVTDEEIEAQNQRDIDHWCNSKTASEVREEELQYAAENYTGSLS